jgi:hypothetical protein
MDNKITRKKFLSVDEFKKSLEISHLRQLPNFNPNKTKSFIFRDSSNITTPISCSIPLPNQTLYNEDHNYQTLSSLASNMYSNYDTKLKLTNLKHKSMNNFNQSLNRLTCTTLSRENLEDERNNLASFYHMSQHQITCTNANNNKDMKKQYFQKYKINKEIDYNEKNTISKLVKGIDVQSASLRQKKNSNLKSMTEETDHVRTQFRVSEEFFKSPIKSLKKIKINKQIFNNIMMITTSKQTIDYMEKFNQVNFFVI